MKKFGVPLLAFFTPLLAFAQDDFGAINEFFTKITNFINSTLIPLVFGIALLVFLWGIFQYFILGGADQGKRDEGKQLMLYSIIGFVVMVSIFGIVNMIASGLNLDNADSIQNIPNVPSSNT